MLRHHLDRPLAGTVVVKRGILQRYHSCDLAKLHRLRDQAPLSRVERLGQLLRACEEPTVGSRSNAWFGLKHAHECALIFYRVFSKLIQFA